MSESIVECTGVAKSFGAIRAVDGVDFALQAGGILALVGPSGCGKTTLLRLIAGFEVPDAGTIRVAGRPVADANAWVPPEERRVGIVFQDYALFPHMTVAENVAFGLRGYKGDSRKQRVMLALENGRVARLADRYPYQLSGGEQQRVALTRTIVSRPLAVLFDEPLSNLDPHLRGEIRRDLKRFLRSTAMPAIYVTHDQQDALFMGDTVAVMNQGRLEQMGTPHEVYERPATRFTATFLGPATFLEAQVTPRGFSTEAGLLRQDVSPDLIGQSVDVLVRPDDVAVSVEPDGQCQVMEYHFQGTHGVSVVRLPSGALLQTMQAPNIVLHEGESVAVDLQPGHPLRCFRPGEEAALPIDAPAPESQTP